MILIFFCPDRDSLHKGQPIIIHKMVVPGEPVIYYPTAREVIDARYRTNWPVTGYFQTCDSCLIKGVRPELVSIKNYSSWNEGEED